MVFFIQISLGSGTYPNALYCTYVEIKEVSRNLEIVACSKRTENHHSTGSGKLPVSSENNGAKAKHNSDNT